MSRAFLIDLAERVVFSFIGGALATLGAVGADITDLSLWQGAAIAGGTAVVALLKGLAAQWIGDESPGLKR